MYIVLAYQGHQYIVKQGDTITVDRVDAEEGSTVSVNTIVASFNDDGSTVALGKPYLSQTATCKVVEHVRADKIRVVKFQSKKRYMRTIGHRQDQTVLSIESIA